MGQRELLLAIGAIVLFSMISYSVNQASVRNSDAIYTQQAELYAVSIAQRFIEEAKTKAFDESTIAGNPTTIPGGFTYPGSHGHGESYPDFDDVDDFTGYSTTLDTKLGPMSIDITIQYVQDTDLDQAVTTRTFYKRMTVTVQSDYLRSPIIARYVFAFQKNHPNP